MFIKTSQLLPLPYSRGKSIRFSDKLYDFFVTIRRMFMSTVYFLAQLDPVIFCLYYTVL